MKVLKAVQGQTRPDEFILIVILPNSAAPIRNAVKHWGDVKYGTSMARLNSSAGSKIFFVFRCDDSVPSVGEVHGRQ